MNTGTVKWFSREKGYGFIAGDNGADIFVHYSGLATEGDSYPEAGQRVDYDVEPTEKGTKAINVTLQ